MWHAYFGFVIKLTKNPDLIGTHLVDHKPFVVVIVNQSSEVSNSVLVHDLHFLPILFSKMGKSNFKTLKKGPLKKWTEHSLDLHLLKIHSRGASITPLGWSGIDFLAHELL